MAVLAENGRTKLWFGTVDRMEWVATPNRGADVSPEGWDAGGSLLNGGAYQLNSFNSAKNYVFEWPASSAREAAQLMKSYADGTYGRGLIYFVDPLCYTTNILPAMWADPSMGVGSEAGSLVPGITPTGTPTSGNPDLRLPVRSAFYDLTLTGTSGPDNLDDSNSVFLPVPQGYSLRLAGFYSSSGSGGVYASPVGTGGSVLASVTAVEPSENLDHQTVLTPAPGTVGYRIWVGKILPGGSGVTLSALSARLAPIGEPTPGPRYWVGGQGNSGCRFSGKPTYINQTGVNGGQVSYAASFREVGSWGIS